MYKMKKKIRTILMILPIIRRLQNSISSISTCQYSYYTVVTSLELKEKTNWVFWPVHFILKGEECDMLGNLINLEPTCINYMLIIVYYYVMYWYKFCVLLVFLSVVVKLSLLLLLLSLGQLSVVQIASSITFFEVNLF